MYLENKIYTTEEFRKALNFTKPTWDRKRNYILDYLSQIMDYNIIKEGTYVKYEVIAQYEDWQGMPRKNSIEEIKKYYAERTAEIVKEQPRNTGSNISRIIEEQGNKYHHSTLTSERYVRKEIKANYKKSDYLWCTREIDENIYYIMTQEQKDFLFDLFSTYGKATAKEDYQFISSSMEEKDETAAALTLYKKKKNEYKTIINKFLNKYGSIPVNVPKLELILEENC